MISQIIRKFVGVFAYFAFGIVILVGVCVTWYKLGVLNAEARKGIEGTEATKGYEQAGVYGDSFGYVNSLFSGLAFGGVVFAIILQTIELRHQREEMEQSNLAVARSASAHEQSIGLNALAALIQAYLEEYTSDKARYDEDYMLKTLLYCDDIEATLRYKIDYAKHLLEKNFATAYGAKVGAFVFESRTDRRRSCWSRCLREARDLAIALGSTDWSKPGAPQTASELHSILAVLVKSPDALGPSLAGQYVKKIENVYDISREIQELLFGGTGPLVVDTGNITEIMNSCANMKDLLIEMAYGL